MAQCLVEVMITSSKHLNDAILCRFSQKKESLQLNLMPLAQSSKPGHLYFRQELRVN